MNGRERFQRVMHFEPVDRVPNIEVGAWRQTVARWCAEGMPADTGLEEGALTFNGNDFFRLDRQLCINLSAAMMPGFEPEVIDEDDRTVTARNRDGAVTRGMKDGSSMAQYLSFAVQNRADFEAVKRHYDPSTPGRYPDDWAEIVAAASHADSPVWGPAIGSVGFFSMMRRWMGTENACTIFYDDPGLAHDMCEFIADFAVQLLSRAVSEVKLDYFMWFEDYSFKTGPLVSPAIFKEFLRDRYRRVNDLLRAAGIDAVFLDTDGDPRVLLPLLLDAGVNGTYPIECAANMDPVALRREYGRELLLWGGIDKRVLARGKPAIDRELTAKLPPLLAEGGYLPMLDHLAPPDIPYCNWLHYLDVKRRLLRGRDGA